MLLFFSLKQTPPTPITGTVTQVFPVYEHLLLLFPELKNGKKQQGDFLLSIRKKVEAFSFEKENAVRQQLIYLFIKSKTQVKMSRYRDSTACGGSDSALF